MSEKVFNQSFKVNEVPWRIYTKQKGNQIFKLLPLKEEKGEWEKQLDTILIELYGLQSLSEEKELILLTIIAKLSGLRVTDDFVLYRKTVFEVMSLVKEWGE